MLLWAIYESVKTIGHYAAGHQKDSKHGLSHVTPSCPLVSHKATSENKMFVLSFIGRDWEQLKEHLSKTGKMFSTVCFSILALVCKCTRQVCL